MIYCTYIRVTAVCARGMTGAMPPDIGHLTSLRHLYLGDNQLSGGGWGFRVVDREQVD